MDLIQALSEMAGKWDLTLVILTGALLMTRILPVIILSPVLGGENTVPAEVKIGIGLTLTIVLYPGVAPRISHIPVHAIPFIALLLKELFIGVFLAMIIDMVFEAAEAAGTLIDLVSGGSQATLFLPQLDIQVSLFANLKTQLCVVLFLTVNGHHQIISALADSIVLIPLDRFPEFSRGTWPFFDLILRSFAEFFRLGLALAAPVILVTILVDMGLGMINRVAPQLSVYFISLSIKPLATVLIMFLGMHLVVDRLFGEFERMISSFREAIQLLV
jgi:flagellar biosynthesis protein FliR